MIQVLAEEVASQIAAGEVIERPASVVKEMIENAIDAQSTQITVHIEDAGRKLIEISDDGCGIPADELETAVKRHATSKLRTADDLFHITTLGFRGEALAAAGSVSHMTITTRTAQSEEGRRIVVDGGTVSSNRPASTNVGTIISIEDLFYNVPARLKFLKSDQTERNQIETLIYRYALAYSTIRWKLICGGKTLLQTTGNGDYREILAGIYSLETAKQFIEIDLDDEEMHIFGYISPVALTRANRREMNYFVNGRWIQDAQLNVAVARAYQNLIMVGRFPIVALFLSIPTEEVDVNVHPAKAEVRFRSPDKVIGFVHRAVRRGLITESPVPELNTEPLWPSYRQSTLQPFNPNGNSVPTTAPLWRSAFADTPDEPTPAAQSMMPEVPEPQSEIPDKPETPIMNASGMPTVPAEKTESVFFPLLRWIGQLGSAYIIAEGPDGLYLVDQHAAHERILYEKVLKQEQNSTAASQMLLEPEIIQLPPWQASRLNDNLGFLRRLGFGIEEFGPSAFRVSAMPTIFSNGSPQAAIAAVVEDCEEDVEPLKGMREEQIAARVCKRMAVKAGQVLSMDEQRKILQELEQCDNPRTCPHGRPTMIHLSISLLEKQFGRRGAL